MAGLGWVRFGEARQGMGFGIFGSRTINEGRWKMEKIELVKMVWDTSIYPRQDVSEVYVKQLVESLKAGESFPSIVIESKGNRIVDGVHRWKAYRKFLGGEGSIDVDIRDYENEQEIFLAAIQLNTPHGLRLSPFEVTRCLTMAKEMGITRERVAQALRVTAERAERIFVTKTGFTRDGKNSIPLKGVMHPFHGETLTKKQISLNEWSGGMNALYYVNQVIGLLEIDIAGKLSTEGIDRLFFLRDLLNKMFPVSTEGGEVKRKTKREVNA